MSASCGIRELLKTEFGAKLKLEQAPDPYKKSYGQ